MKTFKYIIKAIVSFFVSFLCYLWIMNSDLTFLGLKSPNHDDNIPTMLFFFLLGCYFVIRAIVSFIKSRNSLTNYKIEHYKYSNRIF